MATNANTYDSFARVIADLNHERGWGLGQRVQQRYASELARLHAIDCHPLLVRPIVTNYHLDHRLLEELRDHHHEGHHQAWLAWMPQVLAVLRHEGLAWTPDGASDIDDLVQIACLALARALPEFRYESRYTSWAFAVIVRSVRSELRSRFAKKRSGKTVPLDVPAAGLLQNPEDDHPESHASAAALLQLARTILEGQPDRRLAHIFHLWAIEDRQVAEIGAQFGLSQPRVRVLLRQIKALLSQDVRIRSWLIEHDPPTA